MKFYFFSKLFNTKGNNNVSDSANTNIQTGPALSDYCREMIHKLMDENSILTDKNIELTRDKALDHKKMILIEKENKRLRKLLTLYLDGQQSPDL